MGFFDFLLAVISAIVVYGVVDVISLFLRLQRSPLRQLPGPPSPSLIFGSFYQIAAGRHMSTQKEWEEKYGHVFVYKSIQMGDKLYTTDIRAIRHVLSHSMDYQKPPGTQWALSRLLGNGILATKGEKHRHQRRIMKPAFAPATVKDCVPIFFQKAHQLADVWRADMAGRQTPKRLDIVPWLNRVTLDIIGLACFGYNFQSLDISKAPNELQKAFSDLFSHSGAGVFSTLQATIPILRCVPTARGRVKKAARQTMDKIGKELLRERQEHVLQEKGGNEEEVDNKARVEKTRDLEDMAAVDSPRDLLSVLVKENMNKRLPESQRMSDEDVVAQVSTFFVAGHDTSSTETMWCIFELAAHPEIQAALKKEARAAPLDNFDSLGHSSPSADTLGALPILDSVVRETLRLHSVIPVISRVAMRDDIIPLAKPWIDKHGVAHDSIQISEGEALDIPILRLNRLEEIWGKDAEQFKPERWKSPPEAAKDLPGVLGSLMTFLGGGYSCIGYRFALIEIKALLFTLLRDFEFALAAPVEDYEARAKVVSRPYLRSEPHGPSQMPIMVRVVPSD